MLRSFLDLFFQPNCLLCKRPADSCVCQYCQQQLKSCQLKNSCQFWQGDLPLFVWGIYNGKLKQAIATLKYDKQPRLGELMGSWLGNAWLKSPLSTSPKMIVIPIPLHDNKLQERGFNQTEILSRSFCQLTGYTLHSQGLVRIRETPALFGLSSLEREKNLRGAFVLGKTLKHSRPNSPVLLVDDIYTTGTTVKEAARVLRNQKIPVLGVAAIATPKVVLE